MRTVTPFRKPDLPRLGPLQPPDWPDIQADVAFYLKADNCLPVKYERDGRILGIGALIRFQATGWLAHIITLPEYRGRGIASATVAALLAKARDHRLKTVLLSAAPAGVSIYERAGFRTVSEYCFFTRQRPWQPRPLPRKISRLSPDHYSEILALDQATSGERRMPILVRYFDDGWVYCDEGRVQGFHLPSLREGPILAATERAGLGLMALKLARDGRAVVPRENRVAIRFLEENGFAEQGTRAQRMVLGPDVAWHPERIFHRIGGNVG